MHETSIFSITDLAFGGRGLAKIDGKVVFVDGALPGQKVKARIVSHKRRYAEAKMLEVLERSPFEQELGYQEIPGAPWSRLPLEKQIEYKAQQVRDLFQKFAQVDVAQVLDEVIGSPLAWNYRNKMEYSFGQTDKGEFGLGFKKRGRFDRVESLEKPSGLFDNSFETLLPAFRQWCEDTGLLVYDPRDHQGFFRHMVVRKSFAEDKLLVNLITTASDEGKFDSQGLSSFFRQHLGDRLQGVFHTINDDLSDTTGKFQKRTLLWGQEILVENLCDLSFEVSLDSFFQTNTLAAEKLYKKIVQYVSCDVGDAVLDLYCGTGTIAQVVASHHPEARVSGVEMVPSAVKDAEKNAKRNGLANVRFVENDVRRYLRHEMLGKGRYAHTIMVDPPRAGLAQKVLERIMTMRPKNILYVSCNPATMARDVNTLAEGGYELQQLSIVDQFPHTAHVECVGRLVSIGPARFFSTKTTTEVSGEKEPPA